MKILIFGIHILTYIVGIYLLFGKDVRNMIIHYRKMKKQYFRDYYNNIYNKSDIIIYKGVIIFNGAGDLLEQFSNNRLSRLKSKALKKAFNKNIQPIVCGNKLIIIIP